MDTHDVMAQHAPYPNVLAELVSQLGYKGRWRFELDDLDRGQGSKGLTLVITITTPDSYHPEKMRRVLHYFPVPPAAYDARSWRRWLFGQVLLVERHEACEFFRIGGDRPYAPSHGPGNDPYLIREIGTEEDVQTSWQGVHGIPKVLQILTAPESWSSSLTAALAAAARRLPLGL